MLPTETSMIHLLAWVPTGWELVLIAGLALIFFGNRLPSVARNMGRGITEFKKGLKDKGDEPEDEAAPKPPAPRNQDVHTP